MKTKKKTMSHDYVSVTADLDSIFTGPLARASA